MEIKTGAPTPITFNTGKPLTAEDIVTIADYIRTNNVPYAFRFVNSGNGVYNLRAPHTYWTKD